MAGGFPPGAKQSWPGGGMMQIKPSSFSFCVIFGVLLHCVAEVSYEDSRALPGPFLFMDTVIVDLYWGTEDFNSTILVTSIFSIFNSSISITI